jgi:hypothetical protein
VRFEKSVAEYLQPRNWPMAQDGLCQGLIDHVTTILFSSYRRLHFGFVDVFHHGVSRETSGSVSSADRVSLVDRQDPWSGDGFRRDTVRDHSPDTFDHY